MTKLQLASRYINPSWEPILYQMSEEEQKGFQDLVRLYSPFGAVRKLSSYFGATGAMSLYVGHGQYFDFDYVLRKLTGLSGMVTGVGKSIYGGGKGYSLFGMFASTLGELVERVLGALEYMGKIDRLVYGTYRQLTQQGYSCLGPKDLPLFAPEQYQDPDMLFEPFTEDTLVGWIEGRRLLSGEPVWMPAQLVLLFYVRRDDEIPIGFSTSGGLASHINRQEALYHGITELFERDGVNLRWYCKIPLDIIDFDRPVNSIELRRLFASSRGLPDQRVYYYHNLDIPDVPVVTVIEFDERVTRYRYYSGGGVDLSIDMAILSALSEYGQAERNMRLALIVSEWEYARYIDQMFNVAPDAKMRSLTNFLKIVPFYGYAQNAEKMNWYVRDGRHIPLSSVHTTETTSPQQRWDALMGILSKYGIDPIIFDFTSPQMEHSCLMKTYIPNLAPPFPPSHPLLGHPRYYEVPQKCGLADRQLAFSDLNTDPLPYP